MNYKKNLICLLTYTLFGFNSKPIYLPQIWDSSLYFSYRANSSMERYYEEFIIMDDSLYYKGNDPDTNTFATEINQTELNYLLGVLKNQNLDRTPIISLKNPLQSSPTFSIYLNSGDKRIIDFSISKNQTLRSADWNKHNQIISSIYKIIKKKI